jgi:hypothetical protein
MQDQLKLGRIIRLNKNSKFSLVKTDLEEVYRVLNIKFKKSTPASNEISRNFCLGDEIEFKLEFENDQSKAICTRIIGNAAGELLLKSHLENPKQIGFLKLDSDGKYHIKDKKTGYRIPLESSFWETDLEEVYTKNINKPIEYRVNQTSRLDRLKAILLNRKFSSNYSKIVDHFISGSVLPAEVTGKGKQGFFVKIFDGECEGIILLSRSQLEDLSLSKGTTVTVKVKHMPNHHRVALELLEG